ncbi:MAG: HEAT repeat domain-containing protein [Fidelibacterota bacterium]|nr:MAG: HEAT repeat domain-containing protein [Candidatus Neomarinimicrobiota bacterium]
MKNDLQQALNKIAGHDLDTIMTGLNAIRAGIHTFGTDELLLVTDTLGSLFFIDSFDRPDLQPAVDAAIDILAEAGPDIIPFIMDTFENSDIKANISFAKVLGKIGVPAIPHLVEFYRHSDDPFMKSYALYALGKVKDKAVLAILMDVMQAVQSEHLEVRDSAIRAIGKTMELITPKDISTSRRDDIFDLLFNCIADHHSAIRAKAIRALGKMEKAGLLADSQADQLGIACKRITGQDENYRWDRAFIVRKEAQEVLNFLIQDSG